MATEDFELFLPYVNSLIGDCKVSWSFKTSILKIAERMQIIKEFIKQ